MLASLDEVVMHERVGVHDVKLGNVFHDVHRLGARIVGDKLGRAHRDPGDSQTINLNAIRIEQHSKARE